MARTKAQQRTKSARKRTKVKEFLSVVKSDGCVLCGYKKCISALEFHHVTANKEYQLSRIPSLTAAKREVAKCICVCANCHREIHTGMIEGLGDVKTIVVGDTKQLLLKFG